MTALEQQAIEPLLQQVEELRNNSMKKVWCTYENPETHEIAGVVCPEHSDLLKDDPSRAPLLSPPDPCRPCVVCQPESYLIKKD